VFGTPVAPDSAISVIPAGGRRSGRAPMGLAELFFSSAAGCRPIRRAKPPAPTGPPGKMFLSSWWKYT